MHVAIHRHGATNFAALLHGANGDGKIVDHAEAFAVIGKGVMKSAADVDANTVFQRAFGRQNRAAGVQQEGIHHLRRIWNLHLQLFARAQAAFHQLVHIKRRMDQQDVGFGGRLRSDEVRVVGDAFLQQAFANEAELVGAKNVLADGQEILLAIDEFEGQHGPAIRGTRNQPMILDPGGKCHEALTSNRPASQRLSLRFRKQRRRIHLP